jgi:diaminopimelate epimerase
VTASRIAFEKWHAQGNDYIIVAGGELPFELTPSRTRLLCARSVGIGSDGVLLVSAPADPGCAARLHVYNPDGSEDELSGNGTAQVAAYLSRTRGHSGPIALETAAGVLKAEPRADGAWTIRLSRASLESKDYPAGPPDGTGVLRAAGDELRFRHVFVGNPQCAIEVTGPLDRVRVDAYGPEIESNGLFPHRTNVSFWHVESPGEISARIFERGVGETLSSGSGACGAAVAATLNGVKPPVVVHLPGGPIEVDVEDDLSLSLTSRPRPVFAGTLSEELVELLAEHP